MRILRFFLSLVLFSVVLAGGLSIWGWALFTKPGPLAADRAIVIPQGAGLQGIADTLGREGVLDEPRVFMIGAKVSGAARRLRAGSSCSRPAPAPGTRCTTFTERRSSGRSRLPKA